jgi:uncharacterized membrane protein YkvA (DUF1232 family)
MAEQHEPNGMNPSGNDQPIRDAVPHATTPQLPDTSSMSDEQKAAFMKSPEVARFWEGLKHLPAYAKFVAAVVRDPDVPRSAKVVLGVGGGYALSPIDLVPGVIPVAGQMDDLYAMLTAIQQCLKRMPDDLAQKHLDAAGITRGGVDDDLAAVRDVAKLAVVTTVKFGGKALGRISRAALNFANDQLQRRNTGRGKATG